MQTARRLVTDHWLWVGIWVGIANLVAAAMGITVALHTEISVVVMVLSVLSGVNVGVAILCIGAAVEGTALRNRLFPPAIPAVSPWATEALDVAEHRADQVLQGVLGPQRYREASATGYVEVASLTTPARSYRIPRRNGVVKVYQGDQLVEYLCVQPQQYLPRGDIVLMHKLMIEGDEARYLQTANRWYASRRVAWKGGAPRHGDTEARGRGQSDGVL